MRACGCVNVAVGLVAVVVGVVVVVVTGTAHVELVEFDKGEVVGSWKAASASN